MAGVTFVDICNTLADVNMELRKKGVDTSVYPSVVSKAVLAEKQIYIDAAPIEGVIEAVKRFSEYTKIIYLTARPADLYAITTEWLKTHGLPHGDLHLSDGVPKGELLWKFPESRGASYINFVDDAPHEIYSVQRTRKGSDARINIYIPDQPYNQDIFGRRLYR